MSDTAWVLIDDNSNTPVLILFGTEEDARNKAIALSEEGQAQLFREGASAVYGGIWHTWTETPVEPREGDEMSEKIVYLEKYRPHTLVFPPGKIPEFKHLANGFTPQRMEMRAAGRVLVDGVEMEFQDLRVYIKEEGRDG